VFFSVPVSLNSGREKGKKKFNVVGSLQNSDIRYPVPPLTSFRLHIELEGKVSSLPELVEENLPRSIQVRENLWTKCALVNTVRTQTLETEKTSSVRWRKELTPFSTSGTLRETTVYTRAVCLIQRSLRKLVKKHSNPLWSVLYIINKTVLATALLLCKHASYSMAFGLLGNKGMHSLNGNIWLSIVQKALKGQLCPNKLTNHLALVQDIVKGLPASKAYGDITSDDFLSRMIKLLPLKGVQADYPVFIKQMSKLAHYLHKHWHLSLVAQGWTLSRDNSQVGTHWAKLKNNLNPHLLNTLQKDEMWEKALAYDIVSYLDKTGGDKTLADVLGVICDKTQCQPNHIISKVPHMVEVCSNLAEWFDTACIYEVFTNPYLHEQSCITKAQTKLVVYKISNRTKEVAVRSVKVVTVNYFIQELDNCLSAAVMLPLTTYQWWTKGQIPPYPALKSMIGNKQRPFMLIANKSLDSTTIKLNANNNPGIIKSLAPKRKYFGAAARVPHWSAGRLKARRKLCKLKGRPRHISCKCISNKDLPIKVCSHLFPYSGPLMALFSPRQRLEKFQSPIREGGD